MKKLLSLLAIGACLHSFTAYADPLDNDNFPTVWNGSYYATNCKSVAQGFRGSASMGTIITKFSSNPPYGSQVNFTGTLVLNNWPDSTPYPLQGPMALNSDSSVRNPAPGYYYSYLNASTSDTARIFQGGANVYDPESHTLIAQYNAKDSCVVSLTLVGQ